VRGEQCGAIRFAKRHPTRHHLSVVEQTPIEITANRDSDRTSRKIHLCGASKHYNQLPRRQNRNNISGIYVFLDIGTLLQQIVLLRIHAAESLALLM